MKNTDISQLFGVPFGAQADSTTIAPIPTTKTAIGRASMALGFPKENFQPLDNGGQPVSGADLNGILNTLSRAARAAELGMLHPFSATYAAVIGGYPAGATIAHPSITGRFLICTQDGNSNNPAQNMTGWDDPIGDLAQQLYNAAVLGNYEMPAGGSAGAALWSDSTGQPQYTDGANGTRALALQSALAGLLSLTGGTLTNPNADTQLTLAPVSGHNALFNVFNGSAYQQFGQLTGDITKFNIALFNSDFSDYKKWTFDRNTGAIITPGNGIVPEVVGMSGRVVMQSFVATGPGNQTPWVTFPAAFQPGTAPMVWLQIDNEEGGIGYTRTAPLLPNSTNTGTSTTNTGFRFQPAALAGGSGTSGQPWTLQVLAIGNM